MTRKDAIEEHKTGRWILKLPNPVLCTVTTVCSQCNHKFTEYIMGVEWDENGILPNYCPHCGAKMEVDNQ